MQLAPSLLTRHSGPSWMHASLGGCLPSLQWQHSGKQFGKLPAKDGITQAQKPRIPLEPGTYCLLTMTIYLQCSPVKRNRGCWWCLRSAAVSTQILDPAPLFTDIGTVYHLGCFCYLLMCTAVLQQHKLIMRPLTHAIEDVTTCPWSLACSACAGGFEPST